MEETGRTQYKLSKDGNLLPSNFHIIIENRSHPFCSHSGAKEEKLVPLFWFHRCNRAKVSLISECIINLVPSLKNCLKSLKFQSIMKKLRIVQHQTWLKREQTGKCYDEIKVILQVEGKSCDGCKIPI